MQKYLCMQITTSKFCRHENLPIYGIAVTCGLKIFVFIAACLYYRWNCTEWTFCVYLCTCNFGIRSVRAWRGTMYSKNCITHIGKSLQRCAFGLIIVHSDMLHVHCMKFLDVGEWRRGYRLAFEVKAYDLHEWRYEQFCITSSLLLPSCVLSRLVWATNGVYNGSWCQHSAELDAFVS